MSTSVNLSNVCSSSFKNFTFCYQFLPRLAPVSENEVIEILFKNFSSDNLLYRPVKDIMTTTNVKVSLVIWSLLEIVSLQIQLLNFTLSFFLLRWKSLNKSQSMVISIS